MKRRNYFKGLSDVIGAFYTADTPTVSPLASRSFEVQFSSSIVACRSGGTRQTRSARQTCATGEAKKTRNNRTFSAGYLALALEIEQVLMWVMPF